MKIKKITYKNGLIYYGPETHAPEWLGDNVSSKMLFKYLAEHREQYPQYWRDADPHNTDFKPKTKPTRLTGYYAGTCYGDQSYTTSDTCDGSQAYQEQNTHTPSRLEIFLNRK